MSLSQHQQRVVEEEQVLSEKLRRLKDFLRSKPEGVQLVELGRLRRQELIMELYQGVLMERISAFSEAG